MHVGDDVAESDEWRKKKKVNLGDEEQDDDEIDIVNPVDVTSGQSLSGSSIVWKPVSEGDGNLVILTPPGTDSANVTIEDINGQVIDTGRNVGRTNGNRFTYRFSSPGSGYEAAAFLNIGGVRYRIDNPAARVN